MSFQRGNVRERESIGGGYKRKRPCMTAPESIDSRHRTVLRRNDMLSEACFIVVESSHLCHSNVGMWVSGKSKIRRSQSIGGGSKGKNLI